jgi:hypothetical protein
MPYDEWTTDSSSDSEGAEKDPFADPPKSEFVIPSPVSLSDAEDDVSPSQYRKEMVLKESRGRPDEEEEEEDDCEEEEEDEEEEDAHPMKEKSVERMYTDVINIARQLTTRLEDTRKKELMSRKKTARQFLILNLLLPSQLNIAMSDSRRPDTLAIKSGQGSSTRMSFTNATLLAHPKLDLLVFVCRKDGELSGLKRRRPLLMINSTSGCRSMDVLKWPKPDCMKI